MADAAQPNQTEQFKEGVPSPNSEEIKLGSETREKVENLVPLKGVPEAVLVNPEKMAEILNKAFFFEVSENERNKLFEEFNQNKDDIYNTGSWQSLKDLLEYHGKTDDIDKNKATDIVIGNLYRTEHPEDEENLPPYARLESGEDAVGLA